jgi:hypothetical protein
LADRQAAARLQVVVAAAQAQGTRLGVQRAARVHPAQESRVGNLRHQLIAQRAKSGDPHLRWHARVVCKGHVDATTGQFAGHSNHVADGHVDDHADVAL